MHKIPSVNLVSASSLTEELIEYCQAHKITLMVQGQDGVENREVQRIALMKQRQPEVIYLRYLLQRGIAVTTRHSACLQLFDFTLSAEEMPLDPNIKTPNHSAFSSSKRSSRTISSVEKRPPFDHAGDIDLGLEMTIVMQGKDTGIKQIQNVLDGNIG